jgi:hypothetical protein
VTAYALLVDVTEWVKDSVTGAPGPRQRVFHVSMSNMPPHEWTDGVTLCHQHGALFRVLDPPRYDQRGTVCRGCVRELVAMGEQLPTWMERLA